LDKDNLNGVKDWQWEALSKELFSLKVRFIRPGNQVFHEFICCLVLHFFVFLLDGQIQDRRVVRLLKTNSKNTFFDCEDGNVSKKISVLNYFK